MCAYFVRQFEYLVKKFPLPMKCATVILIKVKSSNALLRVLLVFIRNYVKSILRCKFIILDTYHMNTVFT
jgi:hypothetical protein